MGATTARLNGIQRHIGLALGGEAGSCLAGRLSMPTSGDAKGPYFAVQQLAPLISQGGSVVAITSVADSLGSPMISAYAASKAALRSMVRSMARELLPQGIRVNAVSPGPIDSGILEKAMSADAAKQTRQQMTEKNPMGRFGHPDEVAKAMIFLAFEATYTTGAELIVDGGATQL